MIGTDGTTFGVRSDRPPMSRARLAATVAVVVVVAAIAAAAIGGCLSRRSDVEHVVRDVVPPTAAHPMHTVSVETGQRWAFRNPPGVVPGDTIVMRYDGFGRLLGTVRHGVYVPKASQPSTVPYVALVLVLLAIAVGGLVVLVRLVARSEDGFDTGPPPPDLSGRRPFHSLPRTQRGIAVALYLVGVVLICWTARYALLGTVVEREHPEAVDATMVLGDGEFGHGVLFTSGLTIAFDGPSGYGPGEVFLIREDGLGRHLGFTTYGHYQAAVPGPPSVLPTSFRVGMAGLTSVLAAIGIWRRNAEPAETPSYL